MERRTHLDGTGLAALLAVTLLLAVNQIIIKVTNEGLQPVFFAGLRSALAVPVVAGWIWWRGRPLRHVPGTAGPGTLMGVVFAVEFMALFLALDLTSVGRTAVLFYTMPMWLAVMAHFGLPGEALTRVRALGLVLAFAGTAWAILDRSGGAGSAPPSLLGDLFALLAAVCWALTAFVARRPAMAALGPEAQLLWMVAVSAPLLILVAPAFGPLVRDLQPIHLFWLVFQAVVVVGGGFITWLWLLSRYPAATVASFSFLTPVFGIFLGWLFFDEALRPQILGAAALVAAGIILINRR